MKKFNFKAVICLVLTLVMTLSCFTIASYAGSLTVVTQPSKRSFYEGIDWTFTKDKTVKLDGDLDLTGTVISDGAKKVTYSGGKMPNMYTKPDSGSWKTGSNTVRIYCDDFSGYATTTVKFVTVESISIVKAPDNTVFVKNVHWNPGPLGDCEFTKCDLTGTKINAKYSDGTTKSVSYPENELIGWSVDPDNAEIMPDTTVKLFITFCGKYASFNASFVTSDPYKTGDVTKDGAINSYDALTVLQYATGSIKLDSTRIKLADVNKDSRINSLDALMILQYSVGKIKSL